MSWHDPDTEDTTIYKVVVNHEEQYSIWPEYKDNPLGWKDVGKVGPRPREKSLVDKLCDGEHPVEAGLRPEKTVKLFKEAIDRNYVHVKFTNTKGGTELGVRLDREACDFSNADFENGVGTVHVEGGLTLDYVKVKCVSDIDLSTLEGKGHLVKVEAVAEI
jgi:uncharacterized protein YbdZ (MbtH family)